MSWRDQGERGSAAGARLVRRLTALLPRRLAHALIPPVALYFLATTPAARRASARFLARALGRRPGLLDQYRQFAAFSAVLVDRMYLLRDQGKGFDVRLDGPESERLAERYRHCRDGFFVLSAHMGNFEMARILARGFEVPPVHMVMFEENARNLAAALDALDPQRALSIIALGRPDSMLKVHEALDAGAVVGMLPDRLLDANADPDDVRTLPFLGAMAKFPIGPFRMAALMRRPVLLQLGLFDGGNRYRVVFEELADFRQVARSQRTALAEQALVDYVRRLEYHARRSPSNWFNFYDYWNEEDGADTVRPDPERPHAAHPDPVRPDAAHPDPARSCMKRPGGRGTATAAAFGLAAVIAAAQAFVVMPAMAAQAGTAGAAATEPATPAPGAASAPADPDRMEGPDNAAAVDRIMTRIAAHAAHETRFVEQRYLRFLDAPVESSGRLRYQPPNRLERLTETPKPEAMVLDGETLSMTRDGRTRSLSVSQLPAVGARVGSIRDLLAGDRAAIERRFRAIAQGDDRDWQLVLLPSDAGLAELVTRIVVAGQDERMATIEILQADGDRSLMTLQPS